MAGLWDRLTDILGWTPVEEEEQWMEEEEDEDADFWAGSARLRAEDHETRRHVRTGRDAGSESRIVSLPGRSSQGREVELAVAEPGGFDEVQDIANRLKKNIGVVVNVERMDRGEARRVIDFLSGTVYALDGEMQQVSGQVVMFVPRETRIQVMGEADRARKSPSRARESGLFDDEEYQWQ